MRPGGRKLSRRSWLAGAAGLAAGAAAGFGGGLVAAPGSSASADTMPRTSARRDRAYWVREQAARLVHDATPLDFEGPLDLSAAYGKGLPHDQHGMPDRAAVERMYATVRDRSFTGIEEMEYTAERRLKNPAGGAGFSLWGIDTSAGDIPPPPALDSERLAGEAAELYWLAALRDVPIQEWDFTPDVQAACEDLGSFETFADLRDGDALPATRLFRTNIPGALNGPFISQFMLQPFLAGANLTQQRVRIYQPGFDYMTTWDDWLAVQRGGFARPATTASLRFVHTLRDLASYVHRDYTQQFFLQAALILFELGPTLDPDDYDLPYDPAHPYRHSRKQCAFASLGPPAVLELLAVAGALGLRAAFYQKWYKHPFLRPEAYGGMLHQQMTGQLDVTFPASIRECEALKRTFAKNATYLLPQAYPEGSPMHPAYPSGHAAIAGASATILKALFDESYELTRPVVVSSDGLNLGASEGPPLTLGGEVDKLAWNVALGRLAAGIHWRSDAHWGLRLGEQVALSVLREWKMTLAEPEFELSLTTFDGEQIKV